jgi:GH15 family glucan-1,4-alpha-glucosidase
MKQTLDLAPIGNCAISALIDREARLVWACAPRVDGDPVFSGLLSGHDMDKATERGVWTIELDRPAAFDQDYLRNTPVLRTVLKSADGDELEIIDFAPRYHQYGRIYRPGAFVRLIRPLGGTPRIRIRIRATTDWGAEDVQLTSGSNHIRFVGASATFRLSTNCAVSHILEERLFRLEDDIALFFGPDEAFSGEVLSTSLNMFHDTTVYWREWVRNLAVPLDWQKVVIRAAITLKLCAYEETGAIVAAMTTSIPEHPDSGRNWDYRYCWLRDAYYVVRALNRLGATDLLENYLGFLRNIVDQADGGHVQPVYGVGMEADLAERRVTSLAGYRGMGPVRVGNQAHEHAQHDVYGQIVLSNVQAFFDERLLRQATVEDFRALEKVGERAFAVYDQPDAGLWEFRTIARVHTYSALLCWAACDRLANAAEAMALTNSVTIWRDRAATIRARIEAEAWNEDEGHFAASFGGRELDASLLQLVDLHFLEPDDPRFNATLLAVERHLRRGSHLLRYAEPDDFGTPSSAFNFCTFWFIEALHFAGRTDEARALFEEILAHRTHSGLLSEDIALADGELWGNYPQTYSLVGMINCAVLLSRPWSVAR